MIIKKIPLIYHKNNVFFIKIYINHFSLFIKYTNILQSLIRLRREIYEENINAINMNSILGIQITYTFLLYLGCKYVGNRFDRIFISINIRIYIICFNG